MGSTRYVLDAKSSQLTVQAFAEGLAGIAEHRPRFCIRDFVGDAELDLAKMGGALQFTAKTESLALMDEMAERDRQSIDRVMFEEILHAKIFPEVGFRSSKIVCSPVDENRYRADIAGTVSLHGVENAQSIQAQLVLNEGSLRAYGEFRLRQTDYGLEIASVAGGLVRIKDELKFVFFIVGREVGREVVGRAVGGA
jgi:polyisoprenoid-binding protein YceI